MGSKCRKIYKHIVGDHTVYFINKDGRYHNLDGPAFLRFIPPNFTRISLMEYYIDGKFCNNDGPAIIYFYKSGKIKREVYYENGVTSNKFGPAVLDYDEFGNIFNSSFFRNGRFIFETKRNKTI